MSVIGGPDREDQTSAGVPDGSTSLLKESSHQQPGLSLAASVFSGVGLGFMVGIIMGLSASPTVGVVIGAIGTGLAALLGLNDSQFSTAKALRIGAFGLAVVVAAPAGIFLRDHHLLTPTPPTLADRKGEYRQLGYSEPEALDLLKGFATATPTPTKSVLYASEVDLTQCETLRNPYEDRVSSDELTNFFVNAGSLGRELAQASAGLEGDDRKKFLIIVRDAVCGANGEQRLKKPTPGQCDQLQKAIGQSTQDLQAAIAGSELRRLSERINADVSSKGQSEALTLIARFACNLP